MISDVNNNILNNDNKKLMAKVKAHFAKYEQCPVARLENNKKAGVQHEIPGDNVKISSTSTNLASGLVDDRFYYVDYGLTLALSHSTRMGQRCPQHREPEEGAKCAAFADRVARDYGITSASPMLYKKDEPYFLLREHLDGEDPVFSTKLIYSDRVTRGYGITSADFAPDRQDKLCFLLLEGQDGESQNFLEEVTYMDKMLNKGITSSFRSGMSKAASYVAEKITGVPIIARMFGAAVGSMVTHTMTHDNVNKENKSHPFTFSDYVMKYGSSGVINGVTTSLSAIAISYSDLPTFLAAKLVDQFGVVVSVENLSNAAAAIIGMGSGAAINIVAVRNDLIPDPPTTGENGWIIEGAGNACSTALQYFIYFVIRKATTPAAAPNAV